MKLTFIFLFLPLLLSAQQKFVELTNGKKEFHKSVEIIQKKYEKPFLQADSTQYRIETVHSFQNSNGYFIKNNLTTIKRDFAQRVVKGKISIFRYNESLNYLQEGQSNTRDYFAYQTTSSTNLKQMIYDNLKKDLQDNNRSIEELNKIEKSKKVAPIYYTLGGLSILTSGILYFSNNKFTTPVFILGVGIITIPWITNSKKQSRMEKAIHIYNGN